MAGVVTLATPFLHVAAPQIEEESAKDALKLLLAFFGWLAALVGFVVLALTAGQLLSWLNTATWGYETLELIVLFGVFLAFAALLVVPQGIQSIASERLVRRFTRLREELALSSYADLPVLIIRTTGDEASGVLATSQLLSWLIGRVTLPIAWLVEKLRLLREEGILPSIFRHRATPLPYVMLVAAWALNFAWASKYPPIVNADFAFPIWTLCLSLFFGVLSLALSLFVLWIILVAVIAVLLLLRAATLSLFGIDIAVASVVLDVTVEVTPPGFWRVLNVSPRSDPHKGPLRSLAHSDIYNNEDALAAIAAFIGDEHLVASTARNIGATE